MLRVTPESKGFLMRRSFLTGFIAMALISQGANAAPARLPFADSFETGSFGLWDGGPQTTMSIVTGDGTDGTRSVRGVITAGQGANNYKDFYFGNHPRIGGEAVSVERGLWVAVDAKFDSGFVFGTRTSVHKILLVNFDDANALRRYQITLNVYAPTGEYFLEHLVWNEDRSLQKVIPGIDQNISPNALVQRGQWARLKFFIKPNTPGQNNGIVRLWVNGVLKADHTDVPVRENTNFLPNKVILSQYVTDTGTSGTQRWDNVRISDTDPDAGAAPRPNPPTGVSAQ
jgi:hypothetical protein